LMEEGNMAKDSAPMMHIGNIINTATRKELTEYVKDVFAAGERTGQSGKTIRHALSMFSECQEVKNATVSNCTFTAASK